MHRKDEKNNEIHPRFNPESKKNNLTKSMKGIVIK